MGLLTQLLLFLNGLKNGPLRFVMSYIFQLNPLKWRSNEQPVGFLAPYLHFSASLFSFPSFWISSSSMAIRIQNPKPSISIHPTITPFKTHFNSHNLFITIPPRTGVLQIQPPSLSITRRSFLPSVSGIWDAITGGNNAREAIQAIRRGMLLFRQVTNEK